LNSCHALNPDCINGQRWFYRIFSASHSYTAAMLTRSAAHPDTYHASGPLAGRASELNAGPSRIRRIKQTNLTAGPSRQSGVTPPSNTHLLRPLRRSSKPNASFVISDKPSKKAVSLSVMKATPGFTAKRRMHSHNTHVVNGRTLSKLPKTSTGNSPANTLQRQVMSMVYNEITAYPTEDWCTIIGTLIRRYETQSFLRYFVLMPSLYTQRSYSGQYLVWQSTSTRGEGSRPA